MTVRDLIDLLTAQAAALPEGLDTPVAVGLADKDTYQAEPEIEVTSVTAQYTGRHAREETSLAVLGVAAAFDDGR